MNTERDNFYDWAKDKPDATSFDRLNSSYAPVSHRRRGNRDGSTMPWARLATWAVSALVLVAALKHYLL
jgi:hypothetical protein